MLYCNRIILILITLLYFTSTARCQSIKGIVTDEAGNPAIGASVYLNGTTIGTTTNSKGEFALQVKSITNSQLVVSYLGYESYLVDEPYWNTYLKIELKPKSIPIREVVITKDRFTREQKLKVFRLQFLGTTLPGRKCKIMNEDDIEFHYNYQSNVLTASSSIPLTISNPYLGYKVIFDLIDSHIKFNSYSINNSNVTSSLFIGTSLFIDFGGDQRKVIRRREKSYYGSQLHFFREMSRGNWGKDGFMLFVGGKSANPNDYFFLSDSLDIKRVMVEWSNPDLKTLIVPKGKEIPFVSSFDILYKRRQSKVIFRTNIFTIDRFGNNSHPQQIQFGGDIGKKRVGELLPLDYRIDN